MFHSERLRQEALEKKGHCSPKWTVLRSLQKVYGARKIRGCTIIDAPPFFESAGREESADPMNRDTMDEGSVSYQKEKDAPIFWGDNQGPVVMVWDGMLPGEQESMSPEEGSLGGKDGITPTIFERRHVLGTWRFGSLNRERASPRRV